MPRRLKIFIGISVAAVLTVLAPLAPKLWERIQDKPAVAYLADSGKLQAAYASWVAEHEAAGGDRKVVLALRWSKGLSVEFSQAQGVATLDLISGTVAVEVRGLPKAASGWDVWLVDNQPGPDRSVMPEPGDRLLRVGPLVASGDVARLQTRLAPGALADFEVDLVAVTRAGQGHPGTRGILYGAPQLFQRLYTRTRLGRPGPVDEGGPDAAHASTAAVATLDPLVIRGARLFFNERFNGNGRTCGTCHPADNNLTIDPKFIASLPPNDPLFVAEFVPALRENFENPKLMRQVGLILENLDGFDDLSRKFVMRGVPHVFAMNTSLAPATFDGTTIPPRERTGWSGDGAPGNGTLREFAIGAVTQHFTKTLRRRPGIDFRLPTDEELDAMEAFQRFLGRDKDPDLSTLKLKGAVPRRGLQIFLTNDTSNGTVPAGKCAQCHLNAGASIQVGPNAFVNANFATGVEQLGDVPADLIDPQRNPPDGGFGTSQVSGVPGFGNGTFNTPPLVEAADTPPFFHNNAVSTIEGAVAFFNSQAFNLSPSGQFLASQDSGKIGIRLEAAHVEAVAAFLRVLNALENIRSTLQLMNFVLEARAGAETERDLLKLALSEEGDVVKVLEPAGLHPQAVEHIKRAIHHTRLAANSGTQRNFYVRQAIADVHLARRDLVD